MELSQESMLLDTLSTYHIMISCKLGLYCFVLINTGIAQSDSTTFSTSHRQIQFQA